MMSLYDHLPTLDLHGIDRDYARILINDFIRDHYKIRAEQVVIVHGNGTGIIKKVTQETLRKNKYVDEYKINNFNVGMTVVKLKKNIDK